MNITTTTVPATRSLSLLTTALLFAATALWSARAPAQDGPADPLTPAELETLVGPIALYPDEVLAVVLPASTYPLQVVEAARFLEARESDSTVEPNENWDDSIVALLNYPDVVRLMNDDLDWTWDLGEAVLDDEAAVLDAVQTFRDRAYEAGNLVSDDRQVVSEKDDGVIEIAPADPEVVYIPYYEPESVVVYQTYPVFHYYPYAYPLYYYPYPLGYHFTTGFFWGVTSAFVIGWDSHLIHLHPYTHYLHPYYRRSYYTPYYYRRGVNVTVNVNNYRNVWRPRRDRGARPYDGVRAVRDRDRASRTYDGRRYRYGGSGGRTRTSGSTRYSGGGATNRTGARRGGSSATLPRAGRATARSGGGEARRSAPTNRSTVRTDRGGSVAGNRGIERQSSPTAPGNRIGGRISPVRPDPRTEYRSPGRSRSRTTPSLGAARDLQPGNPAASTARSRTAPAGGSRPARTGGTVRPSSGGAVPGRAPTGRADARPAPSGNNASRIGGIAPSRQARTRPSRPQPAPEANARSQAPARATESAPAPARSAPRSAPARSQRFGSGRGRAPAGQPGRGGRGRQQQR